MNPIVESLLLRSFVLFLMLGSLAGLVVGALLLHGPDRLRTVGNILNRWISTRHINQALDRTFEVEPWFYRHRRISGWLILLSSGYILYAFTFGLDRNIAVIGLSGRFGLPSGVVGGLLDAMVLSALLGALLAVFVSLFLLLRPSMLRDFEQGANRWVSLRRGLKPLEMEREGLDEYVYKYARQVGILLVLGSLYTLALLALWIGHYR
ncbi:hypothetical protein GALL_65320 [mine drainage metagenome]|uniref:Uncharacterized protein n=1 Tax=mine drainage metagenome TaxID=410659 RepID=A0A1J5TD27_9ZZZZ